MVFIQSNIELYNNIYISDVSQKGFNKEIEKHDQWLFLNIKIWVHHWFMFILN